jgi:hypothetical protein
MQAQKLYDDQKQADHAGQTGVQQVLPVLPQAYTSQRDEVELAVYTGIH